MTAQNLLVELFVEELPPKALKKLGDAFATTLHAQLALQGLASTTARATAFASPRRLAVHIEEVAARAEDKAVSHKLMPVSVGLAANGDATPALLKKLSALGADASAVPALRKQMDGKAEALFFDATVPGTGLADGVQKALAEAIAKLPIPKVMGYQLGAGSAMPGWTSVSFVRPAHGLVAMHGSAVLISVEALGLKAGNTTHGHRFEASVDPVVIRDADSYARQLRDEGAVIASFDERRADIVRQLAAAAASIGGGVQPIDDDALLDEVTALVERPNVLICEFDRAFLEVPQECLVLTMKANQKYFPLLDADGTLTNRFLVVANITPDDASAVVEGNERVVRPRLADAKFFFDQDRKKTLESRVEALGKVVYHNKLGSQGERVERVRAIARAIAGQLAEQTGDTHLVQQADTAARLAKTDLVTDMVGEFPELQGTMGRYYALNDGLPATVADAIEDHYKPRFAGDTLPRGDVGTVVALADKLETLIGMFGIGNFPTGDRDPFALRRHALGVIRIVIEKRLNLDLHRVFEEVLHHFGSLIPEAEHDVLLTKLWLFIPERLSGYLRESGASIQEVMAVMDGDLGMQWKDLPNSLTAVRAFATLPEAPALAAANKRIGNILKKAEGVDVQPVVDAALLQEPAERALHAALDQIGRAADAQFEAGDYSASLQTLAALREPVDAFFDGVMVNAEDPALRANRLGLLKRLHDAMNRVADLSRLVV